MTDSESPEHPEHSEHPALPQAVAGVLPGRGRLGVRLRVVSLRREGRALSDPRRGAWLRLTALSLTLVTLGAVTLLVLPLSRAGITDAIDPFGAAAPVAFVVIGAALGAAFVPGPLLAAASGALFGTWEGFAVSVASSVLSAVLSALVSRHAGRSSLDGVSGERTTAMIALARRRGLLVVILQRVLPGVPDAPFSYAFGAIGLGLPAVALGTAIGSSPRAFAYTALGDAAVTGNGALAVLALAIGVVISVAGLVVGVVVVRRHRATSSPARTPRTPRTSRTDPDPSGP